MLETLQTKAALSDVGDGVIAGYASLYGPPADSYRDIIQAGAFAGSLAQRQPALQREHGGSPVGTWLDISEDDMGLKVKGRFDLSQPAGRQAYNEVKAGTLDGLSIGYVAKRARRQDGVRILEEIELHEISVVKKPASNRSRILSVKSEVQMEDSAETVAATVDATETKTTPADERLDKVLTGIEAIGKKFEALQTRVDTVERKANRPTVPAQAKDTTADRKAFEKFLRHGPAGLDPVEVKSLSVADDAQSGYLAPAEFVTEIDKLITEFSPVRQVATVRQTNRAEITTLRRTTAPTAVWVGEEEDRSETEIKYGANTYPVHELATYVDVSLQMLEDSAIDVAAEIAAEFAEAFGATEAEAFVTGSGVKRPMGFMNEANIGETVSGASATITADGLIDLYHALKSAYRPNAIWGMNSATMGAIRKLKTGSGEYLIQTAGLAGAPATSLLGRPVIEMPDMPDVGAGEFPVIFGNFGIGYRIFDRIALSIVRDDLTQRTKGRVRFHGRRRVAGGVRRAEALRKLKIAAS